MRYLSASILLLVALAGCYDDDKQTLYPTQACDTSNVTYAASIAPVMTQYCAYSGCHGGAAPASGIDLSSYAGVQVTALNGKLVSVIEHKSGFSAMPKNGSKLTDCTINKIRVWVGNGAKNN